MTAVLARNAAHMARPRKAPEASPVIDLRTFELAKSIDRIMQERGTSQTSLAEQAGVDQSQLSKFFRGQKGLSIEQILNVLQVLGSALAIDEDPIAGMQLVGMISAHGYVRVFTGEVAMPGVFEVDEAWGPFKRGDRVLFEPGGYAEGRYILVRHPDGSQRVHQCVTRNGQRLLVTTESIMFDASAHKVVGVAQSRTEKL